MPNPSRMQVDPFGRQAVSGGRADIYRGVNLDRQRRFDSRCDRRWGDWFILDVPTPLLWFDNPYAFVPYGEYEFGWPAVAPVVIDLWP